MFFSEVDPKWLDFIKVNIYTPTKSVLR